MTLTLEDIANMCGVSRSTVSRVINGDLNVSEKTRQKVMDVIHKYDFQPNLAARGLAMGHTRVLGLVIPKGVQAIFEEPFFALLIQGVSTSCNALDYSVMLWLAEPDYERRMITKILYNGLADGVIVASMLMDDTIVDSLRQNKLPFMLIGRHPTYDRLSYLDVDNRGGACQAVLHLLRLGRRRVATITGPQNMIAGANRYQGYLDALRDRGIPANPELVVEGDFTDVGGYACMQRLLPYKPDAVFAASDTMAMAAIQVIQEHGLRVPDDIAVIGFDDIPQASRFRPALTTVRQPITRMGAVAAETLIDMIETGSTLPRQMVLHAELVIRESCGALHNTEIKKGAILSDRPSF
jgi:LacI family transcriptional regulator